MMNKNKNIKMPLFKQGIKFLQWVMNTADFLKIEFMQNGYFS